MSNVKRINSEAEASKLIVSARKFYKKVPLNFRWLFSPLIYFVQRLSDCRLKLWLVTGDELTTRKPISILFAAKDVLDKNYLHELAFGDSFQERYLGRTWFWKLPKIIAEAERNCSLIVVQVRGSHHKLLKPNNWFYIPSWLTSEVDIPIDPTVMNKHTVKMDLRKIRVHSLGFEVTQDPEKFDDFYHNMYVPYISAAHRSSAYIVPYENMQKKLQNNDLLLITKQGEHIAGFLIVYEKTGPRLWVSGIRDANREYVKDGAMGALYHFSFLYLKDKGFSKVNLGLSRAFLNDGVLRYKKKWSQKIVGTSRYWFAIRVQSHQGAAGVFLQINPFIFESCGKLVGAVFVDGTYSLSSKEIKQIEKQYFHPGLSKLFIYHLQHEDRLNQDDVPPELSEKIVLRSL